MPTRRLFSKPPLGAQLNRAHPLAQYLRGFWLLNEGGGAPQNLVSSANVGTLGGTISPTWTTSQNGRGLNFTAGGEQVNLGRGAFLDDLPVETLEVFIYLRSLPAYVQRVIAKQDASSTIYHTLFVNTDGTLSIARQRATTNTDYTTSNALSAGNWYHIAATFDTSNNVAAIYINGIEAAYSASAGGSGALTSDASLDLLLGNRPGNDRTFDGIIVFARVWSIYCTPAMATELYANPYGVLLSPKRRAVADALTLISASDTGAGAESSALAATASTTDAGTGGDVATSISASASTTDTGTGSEARALTAQVSGSDSGTLTESASNGRSGSDTATGSETSSLTANISPSDSGTLTDSGTTGTPISGSDSGTLTESIPTFSKEVADSSTGSDSSSLSAQVAISDSGSLTDSSSLSTAQVASDIGSQTDASSLNAAIGATDVGTFTDSGTTGAPITGSDSGSFSEQAIISVTLDVSDTASVADATGQKDWTRDDTATLSDSAVMVAAYSGSDTGTITEDVPTRSLAQADVAGLIDFTNGPAYDIAVADDFSVIEVSTIDITQLQSGYDTAGFTDESSVMQGAVEADFATFSEQATLTVVIVGADSATGTDLSLVQAFFSGVDTAQGTDALPLRNIGVLEAGLFKEKVRILRDNQPVDIFVADEQIRYILSGDRPRYDARSGDRQVWRINSTDKLAR